MFNTTFLAELLNCYFLSQINKICIKTKWKIQKPKYLIWIVSSDHSNLIFCELQFKHCNQTDFQIIVKSKITEMVIKNIK